MDLEYFKQLGNKTNRIIEIDLQMKSVDTLAKNLLDHNTSALMIHLEISDPEMQDMFEKAKAKFLSILPPNAVFATAIAQKSGDHVELSLSSKYQMAVLESVIKVLKQEQVDLNEDIKETVKTA